MTSRPQAVPNIMGLRPLSFFPPNQDKQVIWPHCFPWSSRTWRQLFVDSSQIHTIWSSPATNLMSRMYNRKYYILPLARSSPPGLKDKQFTAPFIPLNLIYFLYFWDWDEELRWEISLYAHILFIHHHCRNPFDKHIHKHFCNKFECCGLIGCSVCFYKLKLIVTNF